MNGIQYFHKFKNFEIHNNIFRCIQVNAMYIKKDKNTTHGTISILSENTPISTEPR